MSTPLATQDDLIPSAEAATVGALVIAAQSIQDQVLRILRDDDCADPRNRFIVNTVRRMRAEGLPTDPLLLLGYVGTRALLEAGAPRLTLSIYVHEIVSAAPSPASLGHYSDLLIEAAARRRALEAAQRITEAAEGGSLTDLLTLVTGELSAVTAAVARVGGSNV